MPNSPTKSRRCRICDFCGEATALVFCAADAAKLCLACDREVHATAPLFTKHRRRLLCDACDSSPAVIVCSTHRFLLCQNCDFELHNSCHDRRPLEGFSGQPSASEIATFVGLDGEGIDCGKSLGGEAEAEAEAEVEAEAETGVSDFWLWDAFVSVDELIVSGGENHGFQAAVDLDALPKDRNSTCGQHKQELIRQLCQLAKSEAGLHKEFPPPLGDQTARFQQVFGASDVYQGYGCEFVPLGQETSLHFHGSKEEEALNEAFLTDILLGSNSEEVLLHSDKNSNVGNDASPAKNGSQGSARNVPESVAIPSKIPTTEVNSADRGSALSRYKEKKRSRRYEKHIRYESRKVLAESRTRIKGRFAKINQSSTQIPP